MHLAGCAGTAYGDVERPTVLLVHGWQGRGLQMGEFIGPLVDAGYRVIALDMPGHGRVPAKHSGVPHFVASLRRIMTEQQPEGGLHGIVAHSLGATSALLAADKANWTGRVVCLGGPPDPFMAFERYGNLVGLPPRARRGFERRLGRIFNASAQDFDLHAALKQWQGQCMGILSAGDDDVPVEESQALLNLAGGECHVLEGTTHRSVMWDERALALGVGFLRGR